MSEGMEESLGNLVVIDDSYEFSAPRFYDFICGESEDDVRKAELWFENARDYAPSPFTHRIKATRPVQQQILCDFSDVEMHKAQESEKIPAVSNSDEESAPNSLNDTIPQGEVVVISAATTEVTKDGDPQAKCAANEITESVGDSILNNNSGVTVHVKLGTEVCTPVPQKQTESEKLQTSKKIASRIKNTSAMTSKNRSHKSQVKETKPTTVRRGANVKNTVETPNPAIENPAIKRQKLDGGKSRQILTINKNLNLPHKTRFGTIRNSSSSNFRTELTKTSKEDRKIYVREAATVPYVSMAEMMRKFQSSTRDVSLSCSSISSQGKPKLVLTRPKTPEFETSQRVRPVKIKSSAELEEEMMANIPKFKARPLNKKIFETTTLPPLPKTAPQPPRFKEFHLETMSRASQNAETSSVATTEATEIKSHQWKPQFSMPKSPCLQTSLRARPPNIKSSEELEKEQLEKIQQFKARPLNKKIFESKGDMGIFCHMKKQLTIPQEFHFATEERIPPPSAVLDLFDKLSISSETHHEKKLLPPTNTIPTPFHLHTEERGAEKEKRMVEELMQKKFEEERARVPKANPYPYTTDYPVVPPRPEPKPCTKPEPFQLESLIRHEEEMQRELEEKRRMGMEEARMRLFKAQPILKEDPIPVPEKPRRPLTEVQEFELHIDHRAVDRAEFDKKIKEKEMTYKRYREEAESARLMEEEKELKQLRRTMVPHARPVPKFANPFLPKKSGKEATKPQSPKLRVDRRRDHGRRVTGPAATTASRMR